MKREKIRFFFLNKTFKPRFLRVCLFYLFYLCLSQLKIMIIRFNVRHIIKKIHKMIRRFVIFTIISFKKLYQSLCLCTRSTLDQPIYYTLDQPYQSLLNYIIYKFIIFQLNQLLTKLENYFI